MNCYVVNILLALSKYTQRASNANSTRMTRILIAIFSSSSRNRLLLFVICANKPNTPRKLSCSCSIQSQLLSLLFGLSNWRHPESYHSFVQSQLLSLLSFGLSNWTHPESYHSLVQSSPDYFLCCYLDCQTNTPSCSIQSQHFYIYIYTKQGKIMSSIQQVKNLTT